MSRSTMVRPGARRALLIALALPLISLVPATSASAAPSCSSGYACWWTGTSWTGTYYGSALNQLTWPSGIVNKDRSVFNNGTSGNAVFTYRYVQNIETMYCVRRGVSVSSLAKSNMGSSHNWKAANSGCY
ncbi:peptidase inhibitor family I36 protein [Cellulomonas triticagri]|uniref:Peptidase inhibitor family I36 protein n=1 Tax=Cellulomonas triticagri TaxID=2483352 RepID=A0A3M2JLT6_9CELL|nr:peptidase inhibitor family I36 protein [Cellulomonas triticagri]RMI12790.1 hypothetical protein EBM89_07160 [Cellulomonas triticagri]